MAILDFGNKELKLKVLDAITVSGTLDSSTIYNTIML